jgi:glutaredoxin
MIEGTSQENIESMVEGSDKKIRILIFGAQPPCVQCLKAERLAREAAATYPEGLVSVEKYEAWSEMGKKLNITQVPTTVINGEKVAVGQVLEAGALKRQIDRLRDEFNH